MDDQKTLKLLILYASYGDGHLQAARAIRDALEESGKVRTVMVDLMAESHPWINHMSRRFYERSYTHIPSLYGWMYGVTRPMKHDSLLGAFLHAFGKDKIRRIIKEEQPAAIIHTFPSYGMPAKNSRSARQVPCYTIMTDFDLHQRWVHPQIDRYYVATEDLKKELMLLGIPGSRIAATGIPLKRGFRPQEATFELFNRYGLSPVLPTVLLMAGASGVMPSVLSLSERLLASSPHIQIALVCGRNVSLQHTAEARFAGSANHSRIRIFGYVEPIHELMSLASCIVTKPGGITLSEAIAADLPIFTYRPVPGQERRNAFYLASKGAATVTSKPEELVQEIARLLTDPEMLQQSRSKVRQLQTRGAASAIARDILERIGIISKQASLQ